MKTCKMLLFMFFAGSMLVGTCAGDVYYKIKKNASGSPGTLMIAAAEANLDADNCNGPNSVCLPINGSKKTEYVMAFLQHLANLTGVTFTVTTSGTTQELLFAFGSTLTSYHSIVSINFYFNSGTLVTVEVTTQISSIIQKGSIILPNSAQRDDQLKADFMFSILLKAVSTPPVMGIVPVKVKLIPGNSTTVAEITDIYLEKRD
jgi:hypothetical protein